MKFLKNSPMRRYPISGNQGRASFSPCQNSPTLGPEKLTSGDYSRSRKAEPNHIPENRFTLPQLVLASSHFPPTSEEPVSLLISVSSLLPRLLLAKGDAFSARPMPPPSSSVRLEPYWFPLCLVNTSCTRFRNKTQDRVEIKVRLPPQRCLRKETHHPVKEGGLQQSFANRRS